MIALNSEELVTALGDVEARKWVEQPIVDTLQGRLLVTWITATGEGPSVNGKALVLTDTGRLALILARRHDEAQAKLDALRTTVAGQMDRMVASGYDSNVTMRACDDLDEALHLSADAPAPKEDRLTALDLLRSTRDRISAMTDEAWIDGHLPTNRCGSNGGADGRCAAFGCMMRLAQIRDGRAGGDAAFRKAFATMTALVGTVETWDSAPGRQRGEAIGILDMAIHELGGR